MTGGSNKRTLILLLLLVAVSAIAYPMLRGDSTATNDEALMQETVAKDEVLNTLTILQSINIDTNTLASRTFASLIDFTLPLPNIALGRLNPFATIGR